MWKALLKKQWLSALAFFTQGKNGKRRSTGAIVGFTALMVYAFGAIVYMFYEISDMLCAPLLAQDLAWLYFAFMGAISTGFGVIGSIFMAKSKLYEAKDNDVLLSMPIPAWLVLFSRIVGLYLFTLLFQSLIFIPCAACYFITAGFSFPALLGCLFVWLVMPLGTLAICCILGWLLAIISAKLPGSNWLAVVFSVLFFAGYMAVYSKINEYLGWVLAHGGLVADKMQTVLYPFAKLGLTCAGDFLSGALLGVMFVGAFALVYWLLSKTYIRLATARRGGKKVAYKGEKRKQSSVMLSLIKKEGLRYFKNPMVALNCFLGTIMFVVFPFVCLFSEGIKQMALAIGNREWIALILGGVVCLAGSANALSASSVSLEGESLWILRSLPVQTERVLTVKWLFHYILTAVPALLFGVFACVYFKVGVWFGIAAVAAGLAFILFTAILGLIINLKFPNLHWTNELVAVKQGFAPMLGMFSGWGALALLVGGWFLFGKLLFTGGYFLVASGALLLASGLLSWWLYTRGKKVFEDL